MTRGAKTSRRFPAQTTVARPTQVEGVGLHLGQRARVRLLPAPAGFGVVFARVDLSGAPRVQVGQASPDPAAAQRRTELVASDGQTRVTTPEHFLAACMGLGLDNVLVELNGPELPIFDGSAAPFVELIDQAGIAPLDAMRRPWRLKRPVVLAEPGREIVAIPAESMQLAFFATLSHAGIADQAVQLELASGDAQRKAFRAIAASRTFVFYEEVEKLRQAGLIRGGSLDCAIVLRDGKPLPESGDYRLPNELAWHKLLDLLGDLALLGRPIGALITARGTGHALHQAFLKTLAKEIEE